MSESLHDMLQLVCVVLLLCTHLPSVNMADGSENEDDSDVRLCTKTIVLYGKGEQWIPTQKNEEGRVWVSVAGRWDRGFTKFVFGKALDLRKDKYSRSLNSKFFDDLMTQRQSTFNEAIQKRLQSEDDQEHPAPKQGLQEFQSHGCETPAICAALHRHTVACHRGRWPDSHSKGSLRRAWESDFVV